MNKEYIITKLAAMTTAMRDAAISKVKEALTWHYDFGRYGERADFLPALERAIKEGDLGAKLFSQQKNASPTYVLKDQLSRNYKTLSNLELNRNKSGDILGIDDKLYETLSKTPSIERPKVLRGVPYWRSEFKDLTNQMPPEFPGDGDAFINYLANIRRMNEKREASSRYLNADLNAIKNTAQINVDKLQDEFFADMNNTSNTDVDRREILANLLAAALVTAGVGGGGYYLYKKNKEKRKNG